MTNQYTSEKELPDSLYHYTSIPALNGIITHKELWAFNTNSMNDTTDSTHFVKHLKNETRIALEDKIAIDMHTSFFNKLHNKQQSNYAICFSSLADDAAQWERYAANAEGVCITFNAKLLQKLLRECRFFFNKVIYKDATNKHAHYQNCIDFFNTGHIDGFNEDGIIDNILAYSSISKHSSFKTEHEIRCTTLNNIEAKNCRKTVELVNNEIKDFLKFDLKNACKDSEITIENVITHISIGPRSKQSIPALSQFLKDNGFPKLADNVSQSSCPLR